VLAKHDENYMPPEVMQALEQSGMKAQYQNGKQGGAE
jgi:cytochrome c-type biogenesis protein CcmE